jgi:hypothetical protein
MTPSDLGMALMLLALLAGNASAQNGYESSPYNWQNSPYNWRNAPENWQNNPFNWDVSPHNWQNAPGRVANRPTGPSAIVDPRRADSYLLRSPAGGLLRLDRQGRPLPLDPIRARSARPAAGAE